MQPELPLKYFEAISAIPRGSGNEKAIADYIENFASKRGLNCVRDGLNNVFITKEATKGYENVPPILLQGHSDMVCEKNAATKHDFLSDGLKLKIENGFLTAEGTTLGADDGAAVAMMLAVLDDGTIAHPYLECLFTTSEETGMEGADGFDYSLIKSRRMLNIDSEEENTVIAGCAGGCRSNFTLPCEWTKLTDAAPLWHLSVSGLAGGHSGGEIHTGKASAIKLTGRILNSLYEKYPYQLAKIDGGTKDNSITRECDAFIAVTEPKKSEEYISSLVAEIKDELVKEDKGLKVTFSKAKTAEREACGRMMTFRSTRNVCSLLTLVPFGPSSRFEVDPSLIQSSSNPGILKTSGDNVILSSLSRSAVSSILDEILQQLETLARLVGASIGHVNRYPGWKYIGATPFFNQYAAAYAELHNGEKPNITATHGGLECGIFTTCVPGMDAISAGPDMFDIHSPDERLDLASFERMYRVVLKLLETK